MEPSDAVDVIKDALAGLGLAQVKYDQYEAVVAADDGAALPNGSSVEEALADGVDGEDDEGATQSADDLLNQVTFLAEQVEAWLLDFVELGASAGSEATAAEAVAPGMLAPAQVQARANLIASLASIHEKWNKGVLVLVNRVFVTFLSCTPNARSARTFGARRALQCMRLYWSLLRIPGSGAFGLFEPNVLRRSIAVLKRYMEFAAACASPGAGLKGKGKPGRAEGRKPPVAAPAPAPAEGTRRNPRRAAATAGPGAAPADGDGMDEGSDGEDDAVIIEDEEDEEVEEGCGGGGRSKARKPTARKAKGAAAPPEDDRYISFRPSNVEVLTSSLTWMHSLLVGFPLRSHQEFIPLVGQALSTCLTLPAHLAPGHAPDGRDVAGTLAMLDGKGAYRGAHLIALVGACQLALLDAQHASPLTTARVLLKRLKPYLLHGHAGTASAAAGVVGVGLSGPKLDDGDEGDIPGVNLTKPAAPPDARTVRARALYLTRVLIADGLAGQVRVVGSDADPTSVDPIPAHVLCRLPAVTALLQHLCMGAASERADVRAVAAEIVAHLRACLPHSLRRAFLRFLVKFARSNKAGSRLLAVDVAGRLLGAGRQVSAAGTGEEGALALDLGGSSSGGVGSGGEGTTSALAAEGGSTALALALSELPSPSEADVILEAEGYGEDGAAYAGATEEDAEEAGGGAPDTPASPGGASTSTKRGSVRRTSIAMMGTENTVGTPSRSLRGSSTLTPGTGGEAHTGRRSVGGRSQTSRGAGSPFYGRRNSVVSVGGVVVDTAESEGGCADPRPTVTALLDTLLRRASDKSPAVRARSLTILADVVHPSQSPQAKLLGLLLTHLSHAQILAAGAEESSAGGAAEGGSSEVTLHDISFGAAAHGNALSAALAAATLDSSTFGMSRYGPSLPTGVQLLTATGPSPLVPLLVRRMEDDKPAVRKAALSTAVSLALSGAVDILHALDMPLDRSEVAAGEGSGAWQTKASAHEAVLKAAMTMAASSLAHTGVSTRSQSSDEEKGSPVRIVGLWALQHMSSRATDASVMVRKGALVGLHALLMGQPNSATLQRLWLATVVPVVTDAESSVAAISVECIRSAVVDPLVEWHGAQKRRDRAAGKTGGTGMTATAVVQDAGDPTLLLPWMLLATASSNDELCGCLGRAMGYMAKPGAGPAGGGGRATAASAVPLPVDKLIDALTYAATAVEAEGGQGQGTTKAVLGNLFDGEGSAISLGSLTGSGVGGRSAGGAAALTAATYRRAAWLLLELLATQAAGLVPGGTRLTVPLAGSPGPAQAFTSVVPFLIKSWGTMEKDLRTTRDEGLAMAMSADAARVLRVFSLVPSAVQDAYADRVVDSINRGLRSFSWEPLLVSAAVAAVSALSASHCKTQEAVAGATSAWWLPLQSGAEELLRAAAQAGGGERVAEADVGSCLFTVGEGAVVALDPDAGNGLLDRSSADGSVKSERRLLQPSPSPKLVTLVQALLSPPQGTVLPESVRAQAVLALGKLCLRDSGLAKASLAVLVRDLHPAAGAPPSVRNNCLFVLCDLCVRYTSLVDRHSLALAGAISDPLPIVRRHAIVLLAGLVGSDYLRWRGPVFYRFAAALADPEPEVRIAAAAALTGPLLAKNRTALQAHFVDLIFVLTGCTADPAFAALTRTSGTAAASSSSRGGASAAVRGKSPAPARLGKAVGTYHAEDDGQGMEEEGPVEDGTPAVGDASSSLVMPNPLHRLHVYRTLLSAMSEEQRFKVHSKLGGDVLNAVLEGKMKLTPRQELLKSMQEGGGAAGRRRIVTLTPSAAAKAKPGEGVDGPYTGGAPAQGRGGAASASAPGDPSVGMLMAFPLGTTESLICEVLAVLSSPEMRVSHTGAGRGGKGGGVAGGDAAQDDGLDGMAGEEGGDTGIAKSLADVKSRMMQKVAKKAVLEVVLPAVIAIKAMVADAKSPLLGPIMAYLASLFHDHGDDAKEVLAADRQTIKEVEYDLRRYKDGELDLYAGGPFSFSAGGAATAQTAAAGSSQGGRGGGGKGGAPPVALPAASALAATPARFVPSVGPGGVEVLASPGSLVAVAGGKLAGINSTPPTAARHIPAQHLNSPSIKKLEAAAAAQGGGGAKGAAGARSWGGKGRSRVTSSVDSAAQDVDVEKEAGSAPTGPDIALPPVTDAGPTSAPALPIVSAGRRGRPASKAAPAPPAPGPGLQDVTITASRSKAKRPSAPPDDVSFPDASDDDDGGEEEREGDDDDIEEVSNDEEEARHTDGALPRSGAAAKRARGATGAVPAVKARGRPAGGAADAAAEADAAPKAGGRAGKGKRGRKEARLPGAGEDEAESA